MKAFLNPLVLAILSVTVEAVSTSSTAHLDPVPGIHEFIEEACEELVNDMFSKKFETCLEDRDTRDICLDNVDDEKEENEDMLIKQCVCTETAIYYRDMDLMFCDFEYYEPSDSRRNR